MQHEQNGSEVKRALGRSKEAAQWENRIDARMNIGGV